MTPIRWEQLTRVQQQLLYAIETRLKLELSKGVPVRNLYLRPDMFRIFEDIVKRQFNEDEIATCLNDYMFMKVHIKNGSKLQFEIFTIDTWANTARGRRRQREELKMSELN